MATQNGAAEYILPTHVTEADRLNQQHILLCRIFGGLYRAPLKKSKVKKVLDIGCGTGIWLMDFAREFPDAEVWGLDIGENPEWKNAPSNCKFLIGDVESRETWNNLPTDFDMIHGRFLLVAMRNWPELLASCYEHLAPGGWVEEQELQLPVECMDEVAFEDCATFQLMDVWVKGLKMVGISPRAIEDFPRMLSEAGFVNETTDVFSMYVGSWPEDQESKEIGRMGLANATQGFRGFTERIFRGILGWSEDAYEKILRETIDEMKSEKYRLYLPVKVCYAMKQT
jgi:ubiquinone/menaquinone biosynthesis C-methylase UbiE